MCESWGQLGVQGLTWDPSRDTPPPIQEFPERFTALPLGPEECLAQLWFLAATSPTHHHHTPPQVR